jgi:hypothetical protein
MGAYTAVYDIDDALLQDQVYRYNPECSDKAKHNCAIREKLSESMNSSSRWCWTQTYTPTHTINQSETAAEAVTALPSPSLPSNDLNDLPTGTVSFTRPSMCNFTLYVLSECHRDWAQRSSQESYPAQHGSFLLQTDVCRVNERGCALRICTTSRKHSHGARAALLCGCSHSLSLDQHRPCPCPGPS